MGCTTSKSQGFRDHYECANKKDNDRSQPENPRVEEVHAPQDTARVGSREKGERVLSPAKNDRGAVVVEKEGTAPSGPNGGHGSPQDARRLGIEGALGTPADSPGSLSFSSKTVVTEGTSARNGSCGINRNISAYRLKKSVQISDVYEISSEVLGKGVSGAVRVACHKETGRRYAVKTLSLTGVNAKKAAMLHNEVAIYLQLDHPNIAKLIEVYETEQNIHLVMELCTGGELYYRLSAQKKYSESDAADVTQQMLSAINYCHQHRICHRDIKLENWVYAESSPDAPLKLIDFGFSRIFNPGVPMTAMHGTIYYVSPEVMDGCYQEKCDIWSIGVIVYMLLSGSPPFNGAEDHEILIKIKRGLVNFSGPRWEGISEMAKSFISFLLQKDPDKRPSAEEALQHPWLQRRGTPSHDIDLSVVKSMRNFAQGSILRRAAMGVVALGMTSQEVDELEVVFRRLDKLKRGTIRLQDLATVLVEKLNIDDAEAKRIFDCIDQTGKQEVHYSEFIASTLQAKYIKSEHLVREAFARFDLDKKEAVTLDNLRAVLGDNFSGTRVEDIFRMCDTNGDGKIDYDEFSKALTCNEIPTENSPPENRDSTNISLLFSPSTCKEASSANAAVGLSARSQLLASRLVAFSRRGEGTDSPVATSPAAVGSVREAPSPLTAALLERKAADNSGNVFRSYSVLDGKNEEARFGAKRCDRNRGELSVPQPSALQNH